MSEYKLVPVEPTEEMIRAGWDVEELVTPYKTWAAMLSASPTTDTITIYRTEYEAMKADAETIMQILTDPENQPSQFGTVPLSWYENLENKLEKIRFNVGEVIDSLHGSYERHAIRKVLQKAIAELEAINRRQSMQIAHDGCTLESYESKFKALQATNKKLLDALNSICGTKTSAGWLGEIDDTLFSMLEGEGYGKVSREINRAKAEGLQAIADAEGVDG